MAVFMMIFWPYTLYIAITLMFCVFETMKRLVLPAMTQPTFGIIANIMDALGAAVVVIGTIGLLKAQFSWGDVLEHLKLLAYTQTPELT